jgi:Nucleotide-diphospho-sugar transferase
MAQVPLVISFYTENSPYQLEALNLITSCRSLGIDAEIEGIPSAGSWELNYALKPFYIRNKLLEKKRPVFWVDADAVFKKKPDFSFLKHSDLSFREMKRFSHDRRFKYASGSLFLNYTPQGIAFAEKWCDHCQQKMDRKEEIAFVDQVALVDLIERGQAVKIYPLPLAYCKVFDLDASEIEEGQVVVEHLQASRRFRHWRG